MKHLDKSILIGVIIIVVVLVAVIVVSVARSQVFQFGAEPDVLWFTFDSEKNQIEVAFREESNSILTSYPAQAAPDLVWKEIYGVVDGKIKLVKTIKGEHQPGRFVEERITFPEEEGKDEK